MLFGYYFHSYKHPFQLSDLVSLSENDPQLGNKKPRLQRTGVDIWNLKTGSLCLFGE